MELPTTDHLFDVIEHTWPAFANSALGPWTIRDGRGGGKRVSAATARAPVTTKDLPAAEDAMRALGEVPRFMIRPEQGDLDALLASTEYTIVDPVNIYVCPIDALTGAHPPRTATFDIWEPMAIQLDIWQAGGIGSARIDVMRRAKTPKTALFGRDDNRPAATGYAAIHDGTAMVHALEVLPRHRKRGLGRHMMIHTAHWAGTHGATHLSVICTAANTGANALYASLGMRLVGHYHYRQHPIGAPAP
ncbi:GNAT family N-acetyltransferase [Pseudohalocynthiibacter aestuariivivens]|nr:GNAT family N-acetyltransferase [Pseudohalocynthiibacter aestuariivivens]QIE47225.1 GNAT family N-acetyltransferase [Pseudohalocynthiibacter aestuariivivens]